METLSNDLSADGMHTYGDSNVQHPTEQQRTDVIEMARLGIRHSTIARMFGLPEEILLAGCGEAMAQAALESQTAVLSAILHMAKSGKSVSATIFWLKTFGAHLLPTPPAKDDSQKSSGRPPVDFFVYNNDGEPNADY